MAFVTPKVSTAEGDAYVKVYGNYSTADDVFQVIENTLTDHAAYNFEEEEPHSWGDDQVYKVSIVVEKVRG